MDEERFLQQQRETSMDQDTNVSWATIDEHRSGDELIRRRANDEHRYMSIAL